MELGGSKVRVAKIQFEGSGKITIMNEIIRPISEELKLSDNVELFGFIAQCIKDIQPENGIKIGFTFSYPCILTSRKSGILLEWTKGINASSCIGKDPVQLLQQELTKLGVNAHIVSMCNDNSSSEFLIFLNILLRIKRKFIASSSLSASVLLYTILVETISPEEFVVFSVINEELKIVITPELFILISHSPLHCS